MRIKYNSKFSNLIKYHITLAPLGIFLSGTKEDIIRKRGLHGLEDLLNHEKTHWRQQLELYAVGIILALFSFLIGLPWYIFSPMPFLFYILYAINWAIRFPKYGKKAYYEISFEREAFENQYVINYWRIRKRFAWIYYICKKIN